MSASQQKTTERKKRRKADSFFFFFFFFWGGGGGWRVIIAVSGKGVSSLVQTPVKGRVTFCGKAICCWGPDRTRLGGGLVGGGGERKWGNVQKRRRYY